ncbi:MAG: hypothetical protein GWM98_09680 [Nitrospinaceae bacterium]|nr:hypothetical protein [Nitrospinaceae bacterium]NIR54712.1 hypothetical protein [Nitrospinaceae bacterium]NIS85133.1 hypothetical protein [Nitrospinaceae bacterium]NIT81950.1 hypothetical protein [Nitrospinaceae bacterium]NIU44211.1 hypothetical protein [Nitrospinaceae bacterium]
MLNALSTTARNRTGNGIYKFCLALVLIVGIFLLAAAPVLSAPLENDQKQYENVILNGHKLGFFEVLFLEKYLKRDIPNGNYWFDLDTGKWGHVGRPANGYLQLPKEDLDYVRENYSRKSQAVQIEYSPEAETCDNGCLYW